MPSAYPPPWRDQRRVDADHLRLLSIFHYVFAGLGLLVLGFLYLHYRVMRWVFTNPNAWQHHGPPPPPQLFPFIGWIYVFAAVMIVLGMVLNVLSARYLARRRARVFSLVVAGLDCLQMPFGTALGVFTLIVLLRDSVAREYEEVATGAAHHTPGA
jgi:hypothetical protein